jgi:hypothetical protein
MSIARDAVERVGNSRLRHLELRSITGQGEPRCDVNIRVEHRTINWVQTVVASRQISQWHRLIKIQKKKEKQQEENTGSFKDHGGTT